MQEAEQFIADIRRPGQTRGFLREAAGTEAVLVTRAPGRLDVMGGVADYSGALVAEATIAEAAFIALRPRTDTLWRFWSVGASPEDEGLRAQWTRDIFFEGGHLKDYAEVRAALTAEAHTQWAAYLMGCVFVLLAEGYAPYSLPGANVVLRSAVPLGAGVSSSAAIEVAMMQALSVLLELNLDGVTVARLAQMAENKVVGAPCGIMDQMASALGEENSLLQILCRPHTVQGASRWPDGVRLFGVDSHVVHSVGGGAYGQARVAAFMARHLLGVEYLSSAAVPDAAREKDWLPEAIQGRAFLETYGETGDPVTRVDPEVIYPVRAAAEHAIAEHRRVGAFLAHLSPEAGAADLMAAGDLMYQSHESYTRIGLGSPETDLLVSLAKQAGPARGVYGAKITGGGSGGTVAFLTAGDHAEQVIEQIAADYQAQTGLTPRIVEAGKSPGALAFGFRQWEDC